jgi:putative ABC transport system ATP-binding protein
MNCVISIENVCKKYNMGKTGSLTVLKNINLCINKGEFVAITGPSGSGKSTMMNIVGALDVPSSGDVILKGKCISKMKESDLAKLRGQTIGFIFQQFNLLSNLTALKNVMLPMEIIGINSKIAEKKAIQLLSMLGLSDRLFHKPTELSGGQQQRVAIARSLANDPEMILADEPTGNLDSKTGEFVMDFLYKVNKNKNTTIVLITHDLNLVHYADKIVYIKDGQIEKIVLNSNKKLKGGSKNE